MSKFKKGDKVRIKKDLRKCEFFDGWIMVSEMLEYKGREATIEHSGDINTLNIDNGRFGWADEMLELVSDDSKAIPDGNKWFELFYLGLEQGYSVDNAAKRADKAYSIYENRLEGRG